MSSFLIQTLGCKLNQLESEAIADAFKKNLTTELHRVTRSEEEKRENNYTEKPTVIVINTCTVTSKADQKARRVIRKALRDYPDAKIIVTGCYAQLNRDDILKLETDGKGRLLVIGKDRILDFIKRREKNLTTEYCNQDCLESHGVEEREKRETPLFEFNPKSFSSHTRSFLKIQDGCDKHCTYCKIRLARGKSVSLDAEEVLKRLRVLEETHAEAVITGVNISQYVDRRKEKNFTTEFHRVSQSKEEGEFNLAELLEFLLSGTGKIAIRLSSLAPESVDENLCKVLAHPRIRPHFHLSIQSCSDKILEKMGRVYNAHTVEKAVELLRGTKEDPFIACDIITGFPGETEKEFLETFNICKKLDFAWIHVFPFSKREGTPAFLFKDSVPESEKTNRVELFTELAKQGRAEYVRRWIGKEVDVLVEKRKNFTTNGTPNLWFDGSFTNYCNGVSENYLKVLIRCEGSAPSAGSVVRCKLIEAGDFEDYDAQAVLALRI